MLSDVQNLEQALRASPNDRALRGALADALDEAAGSEQPLSRHLRLHPGSLQTLPGGTIIFPGMQVVTVGSAPSRGGYARYVTATYEASPRAKGGGLIWKLRSHVGDITYGRGITGPMRARAQTVARIAGLPYVERARHNRPVTGTELAPRPVQLARPDSEDRVAQDVRLYHTHVKSAYALHKGPVDHPSMFHDFAVQRGLKVQQSPYAYYDEDTHTVHHPTPEDKQAVVQTYLRYNEGPRKLARSPDPVLHDALVTGAVQSEDPIALGVLADHLEETGHPYAAMARRAFENGQTGGFGPFDWMTWAPLSGPASNWIGEDGRSVSESVPAPYGSTEIKMFHGSPPTLLITHMPKITAPFGRGLQYAIPVDSVQHFDQLTGDIPENQREELRRSMEQYPPSFPTKLARVEGQAQATRALNTDTHDTRVAVARHVLAEAGLAPARTEAVLAHTDERGIRPGVAALIGKPVPPALARYAAAWMGLLTGEQKMTAFHPGDGEDTLHVLDSPHPAAHVGEYLKRAGVPSFTLQSRGAGTRAYVLAPMDLADVQNAARGLQGTQTAIRGTAVRLGAGTASEARSAFRQVIDDAEKEAGSE